MSYLSRIVVHQSSFSEDEVIFNPKHFPALRVGDLVQLTKVKDSGTATTTAAAAAVTGAATHTSPPATPASAASGSLTPAQSGGDGRVEGKEGQRVAASVRSASLSSAASPLYVRVVRLSAVKGNIECSLLSSLAALFDLSARDEVLVTTVTASSISLTSVELSFDRAYIGRSDHWRIRSALQQQTVHMGKAIVVEGMKLRLDEMSRVDHGRGGLVRVSSGLVTSSTRLTFRSRSARLLFLVQMSYEMWEHADDGEVHFEKVVGFFRLLLQQWRSLKVSHSISIVLFSRTIATPTAANDDSRGGGRGRDSADAAGAAAASPPSLYSPAPVLYSVDGSGRLYVDRYEVVVEGETPDEDDGGVWGDRLLVNLKAAIHRYQSHMRWGTKATITPQHIRYTGLDALAAKERVAPSSPLPVGLSASSAVDGNVLEAINCAVSIFDQHYVDRDLYRTGQNIVLCSAGRGLFLVSHDLAQLTKQRMVDAGIGCDLICMTRPPLHAAPLFVYDRQLLDDPFGFFFPNAQPQQGGTAAGDSINQPQQPRPLLIRSTSTQSGSPHTSSDAPQRARPPLLRQYTAPSYGPTSPLPLPYYIPHWISVFFYDYQDLYDTPFGTTKKQPTTATPTIDHHSDHSAAGEEDEDNSDTDDDGDEERGEGPPNRGQEGGVSSVAQLQHSRRLDRRQSSLSLPSPPSSTAVSGSAMTSLGSAGPSVGLSCCRLYDFRPSDPAALTAWLLDSAAPTSTSAWGFSSSTLPPSAFSATFAPPHRATAAPPFRTPTVGFAQSCAAYDEGVFGFNRAQPPHEGAELEEQQQLPLLLSPSFTRLPPLHSPPPLITLRVSTGGVPIASSSSPSSSSPSSSSPSLSPPRSVFPSFSPAESWSLTFARRWGPLAHAGR